MTQPRKPRSHDAIERRIHALEAVKLRHDGLTRIARLEREVAALPDPRRASASELSARASDACMRSLLRDVTRMQAACDPEPAD